MLLISDLLDLDRTIAAELFADKQYPWEVLDEIKPFILALGPALSGDLYDNPSPGVWVARDAEVYKTAFISAPCIIDSGAQIRHGAFIRGSAIIGKNAVVGNSAELKNAVLFDSVQVPHYNYVGDSILGYKAHMGAGSITSNVKGDRTPVCVKNGDEVLETGRKKFGAVLGDFAEIGCNSVLNPGTVIGRHTQVYPLSSVRGVIPPNSIYKSSSDIIEKSF